MDSTLKGFQVQHLILKADFGQTRVQGDPAFPLCWELDTKILPQPLLGLPSGRVKLLKRKRRVVVQEPFLFPLLSTHCCWFCFTPLRRNYEIILSCFKEVALHLCIWD